MSSQQQNDPYWLRWLIVGIGFVLYANTLGFDYALDDKLVITHNQITKRGLDGVVDHFRYDAMDGFWAEQYGQDVEDLDKKSMVSGGRYRPLTLALHALEWEIFNENPAISHFVNAALYGVAGLLLFLWLQRIWPVRTTWYRSPAFWLVILYLVHPLHSEVVANIKGRDELLSFLWAVWAGILALDAYDQRSVKKAIFSAALFFCSLLSKETSLPFLVLIPLTFYFFRDWNLRQAIQTSWPTLAVTALYLGIRFSVLGNSSIEPPSELMNNPFLLADSGQFWATIFLTFAAYLKLLIIPYPLTHDYYPFHLPFMEASGTYPDWSHPAAWAGLLIFVGMVALSIYGFLKKQRWAYGILFFLGTFILVSNAFFPLGVFMNDRFMFVPSFGIYLTLLMVWEERAPAKLQTQLPYVLLPVALVFAYLTITRNYAWESDDTLALTDVEVSDGSAKVHMAAGDALLKRAQKLPEGNERSELINRSFTHLQRSLEIYPQYFPPLDLLATLYFEAGNLTESIRFYEYCSQRKPNEIKFINNIVFIGNQFVEEGKYPEAVDAYERAAALRADNATPYAKLGEVYGRYLQQPQQAITALQRANELDPGNADVLQKLGISYAMLGNFDQAIALMSQSLEKDPENASTLNNLGVIYMQTGQTEKGQLYLQQAKEIEAKNATP